MGLFTLPSLPVNLAVLSGHIRNYLQERQSSPVLKDISAGGCCLEADVDAFAAMKNGDQKYLFFVTLNAGTESVPRTIAYIFLCRKVAVTRHGGRAVFRLKFTHEGISNASGRPDLRWEDIDAVATARLRGAITHFSVNGHELQTACESVDESVLL